MTVKRALTTSIRSVGFGLLLALLAISRMAAQAQDKPQPSSEPQAKVDANGLPEDPAPLTPEEAEVFKENLSAEGLVPGKAPSVYLKTVILIVPNLTSWQDYAPNDLAGDARITAIAFESVLETHIDYKPHLWREDGPRQRRYFARLRFADIPSRADPRPVDKPVPDLEAAARCQNADVIVALSFTPAAGEARAACSVWRYRRKQGIDVAFKFDLPDLGKPGPDAAVKVLEQSAARATAGIVGVQEEAALVPPPPTCANDKALKFFVEMRSAFTGQDLNGAWIAYADLMAVDPRCGRAALFSMEIFKNHEQSSPIKALESGIKAVKSTPNDVLLRGRLAYNTAVWIRRRRWGMHALEQALVAQPRNYSLLLWKSMILSEGDQQKQKAWLLENVLPHFKDGRVEVALGNNEALSSKLAEAIQWYEKAVTIAPDDHEAWFSLAIISTHHGENLQRAALIGPEGDKDRADALARFARAIEAWNRCLSIDVTEQNMVLEFYVRAVTRDYKYLPTEEADLNRLFLIQACRNGLQSGAGGNNFGKLASELLPAQQKLQRMRVKEAKPGDADYELSLCARINFAQADNDLEEIVTVLREMRKIGYRGNPYPGLIDRFRPLLDEEK